MCCGLFECVRGVVFVAVIFSINSCDNLCIYYFGSVSCIQCIVIKHKTTLEINKLPPDEGYNSCNRKLGRFEIFLDDLFTFFKMD